MCAKTDFDEAKEVITRLRANKQQIVHAALRAHHEAESKRLQQLNERINRERPDRELIAQERANALIRKIKDVLGFDVFVSKPLVLLPSLAYNGWSISSAVYELDNNFCLCVTDNGDLIACTSEGIKNNLITNLEDLGSALVEH